MRQGACNAKRGARRAAARGSAREQAAARARRKWRKVAIPAKWGFPIRRQSLYCNAVNENGQPAPEKADLILDLSFVPTWARRPPDVNPYGDHAGDAGSGAGERRSEHRRPPRDPGRQRDRDRRPPRAGEGGGRGDRGERGDRLERAPRAPFREQEPEPPPLDVAFLPERSGLVTVARRIARSGRAYSLFDLAFLFLSQPEYCSVRLAVPRDGGGEAAPPSRLYQCQICKSVFLDGAQAQAHAMGRHLEEFYAREEQAVEPPQGQFVCVARCGLSGELLGPPNYHGFNDRVLELHRRRFSHLLLDEYRRRIENVHEAAVIEQWKEQMRRRTVYRVKDKPDAPALATFGEMEAHFVQHHAAGLVKDGAGFTLPGPVTRELEDRKVRWRITEAWNRESRFPLRLSITLRLALRHLGLHTFKTERGGSFVTAVVPSAIDPAQAIDVIREVLQYLEAHPGCDRATLLKEIRPNAAEGSPELHDAVNQIRWLVDKGHVIEFSDGRLAVPRGAVHKVQHARREERRSHHHGHGGRPRERDAGRPGPGGEQPA